MGLKNSPSSFQRIMRNILRPFIGRGVSNYLDDIVIFSRNHEEHKQILEEVLAALLDANVRLRKEKCVFFQTRIELLGHIVEPGKIKPSQTKIKAVTEFPVPTNVKQLQQYNGLVNYYRKFVEGFSKIAAPLYRLTRKDEPFIWTEDCQLAFENLKSKITSEPVLKAFDPKKSCKIQTDASIVGIGAILSQFDDQNNEYVVEFFSRKLNDCESRYPVHELECLAVKNAIEHFRNYLDGSKFDLYTDNQAITYLKTVKETKGRLFRWAVLLSSYDFNLHHRPGSQNQAADALSRNPVANLTEYPKFKHEIDTNLIKGETQEIEGQTFVKTAQGMKLVIPKSLMNKLIKDIHVSNGHPGIRTTKNLFYDKYWYFGWQKAVHNFVMSCDICQIIKPANCKSLGKWHPIETPNRPNEIWSIDTVVVGNESKSCSAKYMQVIIDHHSRYIWAIATKTNSTEAAIKALKVAISDSGAPMKLVSDNGRKFVSQKFKDFAAIQNIELKQVPAYSPQGQGICERGNQQIIRQISLKLAGNPKLRWCSVLSSAVSEYNNRKHSGTNEAPSIAHFAFENLDQDQVADYHKNVYLRSRVKQTCRKMKHDLVHN